MFEPRTDKARQWLRDHLTPEHCKVGEKIVVGALRGAQLLMWMALEGLEVR